MRIFGRHGPLRMTCNSIASFRKAEVRGRLLPTMLESEAQWNARTHSGSGAANSCMQYSWLREIRRSDGENHWLALRTTDIPSFFMRN